jgi:hypothetical protein
MDGSGISFASATKDEFESFSMQAKLTKEKSGIIKDIKLDGKN